MQAILEHGHSFESFGFFQGGGAPVTLSGDVVSRVEQMPVDVGGLSITGVAPFLGRTYRREDFEDIVKQKEARSIVVTYETWQRLLGGAPDVIGRTIHVDGEPRSVIGVMPPGFRLVPFADDIAFWVANDLSRIPKATWMIALGRLKPGVTPEQAQAESTVIARGVLESRGQKPGGAGTKVELVHEAYFGGARRGLGFLLGAVSFVLLIACANVANMLLAAGAARQKELAVRVAAGRGAATADGAAPDREPAALARRLRLRAGAHVRRDPPLRADRARRLPGAAAPQPDRPARARRSRSRSRSSRACCSA